MLRTKLLNYSASFKKLSFSSICQTYDLANYKICSLIISFLTIFIFVVVLLLNKLQGVIEHYTLTIKCAVIFIYQCFYQFKSCLHNLMYLTHAHVHARTPAHMHTGLHKKNGKKSASNHNFYQICFSLD